MDYRPIRRLSDDVIGQIAAGEVVERPAAAVKELVENSIDAGATAITVELTDGGLTSLRVSDNGRGIPAGQIKTAFERHTTSKLTNADELYDMRTLGFRGEALASIAAVGKVVCISRVQDAAFGVRAQVEAGGLISVTEAASPVGTSISVKELFFNTPVRLKFLKKPAIEAALVSDYILRLILSRPDVAFRFVNQGKTVYRSAGDGTLESALYCVYGKDTLRAMRPVRGSLNGVLVDGYIGVGELARGNRSQQSFFVNGRYFRSEPLGKALESGCEGMVMIGRYPICALFIQLPYRQVDVNVHPNKLEVRFQNPDAVARAVEDLANEALRTVTLEVSLAGQPSAEPLPDTDDVRLSPPVANDVIHPPAGMEPEHPPQTQDAPVPQPGEYLTEGGPSVGKPPDAEDVRTALPTLRENRAFAPGDSEVLLQPPVGEWLAESAEPGDAHPATDEARTRSPQNEYGAPAYVQTIPQNAEKEPTQPDTHDWTANGKPLQIPLTVRNPTATVPPQAKQATASAEQQRMEQMGEPPSLRYIGALFQTYLLFETGERLLMVDQHAAHERVLFDRYMARYEGSAGCSQRLLSPQLVRLTARDVALLADMQETLAQAGFEVEAFDTTSVAVRAIPVILGQNDPVRDLLLDILDETQAGHGRITRDRLRRRVTQMACKHAIKAGDRLLETDVRVLLVQMLATGLQPTCPHGRPIVSEITKRELEKRFKRIQ